MDCAVRILSQTRKYDHNFSILKDLRWLTTRQQIIFKLGTLTYCCPNGLALSYLPQLVPYSTYHSLRSSDSYLLKEPWTRTRSNGDRSFKNAAPGLWNKLPLTIQQIDTFNLYLALKCTCFRRVSSTNGHFVALYVVILLQGTIRFMMK